MNFAERLSIRAITPADIEAILELERQTEGAPHWSREDYRACLDGQRNLPTHRIALLAESGEFFLGFAILRCVAIPGGSEAELESIAVRSTHRHQGIGAALLTAIIAATREVDAQTIDLEVRSSNSTAIRLYTRDGFLETGRRRGYYHNPVEDAVLMRLHL